MQKKSMNKNILIFLITSDMKKIKNEEKIKQKYYKLVYSMEHDWCWVSISSKRSIIALKI